MLRTSVIRCVLALAAWANSGQAFPASSGLCGSLEGGFGPFDYINPEHRSAKGGKNLAIVEQYHFTSDVENLRAGRSSSFAGSDINYTLNAWPNHHRALVALVRLTKKSFPRRPTGLKYSPECYFDRAIRMNSEDAVVYAIYAGFHMWLKRPKQAVEAAERAYELQPENSNVNYNIAVVYADLKQYEKAVFHAQKAEQLGHPINALKKRLETLGVWK